MKKAKLLLAFLIIASMVLPIAACAKDEGSGTPNDNDAADATTSAAVDGTTEEELVSGLPDRDLGGYEFRVITRDDSMHNYPLHTRDILVDGETGEPLNDAVYARNKTLEEKYNFTIKMIALNESDESNPNKALQKSVKAGDDEYDLFLSHMINGGSSAQAGLLLNWNNIPNIDFTKPWWCEGATQGLSVGDNLFLALSDFSISSNDHAYVMLFNKKLAQQYAIEDMYALVNDGKWTFDKFHELLRGVSSDINGDGVMDAEDQYGYIAGGGQLNYLYAGGASFTRKDENNIPYIDYVNDHSVEVFLKTLDIFTSGDNTFSFESWIDDKIPPMFAANRGLFLSTQVGLIPGFRDMETDFGILPYPKWNEAQDKYLNYVDGHAQLMGVPLTVEDVDKIGFIIEALSFESYKSVRPAYFDTALKTKFSRDVESAAMLDYVFDGRIFDFGYVYDNWISVFLFNDLINQKKDTFVSSVEKKATQSQKQLEKVLKTYEELANAV